MKTIKQEYKGQILSNSRMPLLIVDDIKELDYNFLSKIGFDFLFEHKPTAKVITPIVKRTKTK